MLWQIQAPACSVEQFTERNIVEVLYDFDGPKIFTTSSSSLLRLWYECAEDRETGALRYLVVPTNEQTINFLKDGTQSVYEGLNQPWIWVVDTDSMGEVTRGWIAALDEIPESAKPKRSALLWPSLEPIISYRLIGDGLREGYVSASVAARALERPAAALKRLFESMSNAQGQGRPEESFRKAYDLPVQRFAFNSFEVSFGAPAEPELQIGEDGKTIYQTGSAQLERAFDWLESSVDGADLDIGLLEVLKELVPPAHGQIVKAEVRGRMVSRRRVVTLSRADRTKVTQAIRRKRQEDREFLKVEGRIGEFDKDQLTFILRDQASQVDELRCSFAEEHFDDLYEAFDTDARVILVGRRQSARNVFEVVAVQPLLSAPEGGESSAV